MCVLFGAEMACTELSALHWWCNTAGDVMVAFIIKNPVDVDLSDEIDPVRWKECIRQILSPFFYFADCNAQLTELKTCLFKTGIQLSLRFRL